MRTAALWVKRKEPRKSKATRGGRSLYMSFNFLFIKETENRKQMCAVWPIQFVFDACFFAFVLWRTLFICLVLTGHGRETETGPRRIRENRRLKLDTGLETWTEWKKSWQNKAREKGYCESSVKLERIKQRIKAQRSRLDLPATSVSLGHYLPVQL